MGAFAGVDSEVFLGNALTAVDAKGRFSVPAFVRAQIDRISGARQLWIGVHESLPCLTVHGAAYHRFLLEQLDGDRAEGELDDREDTVFGMTEDMTYDPSGRLSLPQMLRDEIGLADLALFVGRHRYVNTNNLWVNLEVSVNPDGVAWAYRIIDPRQFILSVTFDL
jgi:MraZ protein